MYIQVCTCKQKYTRIQMHYRYTIHTHMHTNAYTSTAHTQAYTYKLTHIGAHKSIYIHNKQTHMYLLACPYKQIKIHMHINASRYTIHTYICTQMYIRQQYTQRHAHKDRHRDMHTNACPYSCTHPHNLCLFMGRQEVVCSII